jgi:hypothetical protein
MGIWVRVLRASLHRIVAIVIGVAADKVSVSTAITSSSDPLSKLGKNVAA